MNYVADLLSDLAGLSDTAANLLRDCPDFSDEASYQLRAVFQLLCQIGFMADTAAQVQGNSPTVGGAAEWFTAQALRATTQASRDSQSEGGTA